MRRKGCQEAHLYSSVAAMASLCQVQDLGGQSRQYGPLRLKLEGGIKFRVAEQRPVARYLITSDIISFGMSTGQEFLNSEVYRSGASQFGSRRFSIRHADECGACRN